VEQYQSLLSKLISLFEENVKDCWFQHNGLMACTANTTALLQEFFGEHTVGHGLWSFE
jgi:hypothetical protein